MTSFFLVWLICSTAIGGGPFSLNLPPKLAASRLFMFVSGVLCTLVSGVELNSEQTIESESLQPVLSSTGAVKI